jgi:hypothetical protein
MKRLMVLLLLSALPLFSSAQLAPEGSFEVVKTKTFDGEKFIFPKGMRGTAVNVVFLGMSNSQENGQLQQEQLLDWQAALDAEGVFSESIVAYHFPAMSSPPFFVKGLISNAMAKSYEGKLPMSQAGFCFLTILLSLLLRPVCRLMICRRLLLPMPMVSRYRCLRALFRMRALLS